MQQIHYPSFGKSGLDGLHFKLTNKNGETWIGTFESETSNGLCGVYACPDPDKLLVVSGGFPHYIDTVNFRKPIPLEYMYTNHVVACEGEQKLLFAGWLDVVCIGPQGIAWESRLEYEITKIWVEGDVIIADGLSAGLGEPWQMKASLIDGSILE